MGISRTVRNIATAVVFLVGYAGACVCRADCSHAVYAYENRVIVFACSKTGPELSVILLDDASTLKIAGRVRVPSSREFDTAGHYQNLLMLVRWDKFEVYDLSDPAHPALAATFDLRKQEKLAGYERIEQTAENKFLVLTSMGAVEVITDGQPANWKLKETPASQEMRKKMSTKPPSFRFVDQNEALVPLLQNEKFRYELTRTYKTKSGEVFHRQCLRKVDVVTQKSVSLLPLGGNLETID